MKKYEKPQIFFESFEVSQHVAACGWDMSNSKLVEECTAEGDSEYGNDVGGLPAFIENNSNCVIKKIAFCYENSADNVTIKVFNS